MYSILHILMKAENHFRHICFSFLVKQYNIIYIVHDCSINTIVKYLNVVIIVEIM